MVNTSWTYIVLKNASAKLKLIIMSENHSFESGFRLTISILVILFSIFKTWSDHVFNIWLDPDPV